MLLQYASDLHLEFPRNKSFLGWEPLKPKADILILAGDIVPFALMEKQRDFFSFVSDHFAQTYWLPGNHEYYHSDISLRSGKINEQIKTNIHLINNLAVELNEVKLIFSTLWTHISMEKRMVIENSLSDFRAVTFEGRPFSAEIFNSLHKDCRQFIDNELQTPFTGKKVVISHHVPTFRHYPKKYIDSPINEGFAVDLSTKISDNGPDCWIYGHHHHNSPEFSIGKTRMLTNQLGYVQRGEHMGFSKKRIENLFDRNHRQ